MRGASESISAASFEDCAAEAEALVDGGRPAEALVLAEAAVRLDPHRAEGFAARARARRALGASAAALVDVDAVIARTPQAAAAHDARGVLLAEAGQLEQARAAFEAALRWNPRFARAHFGLAMLGQVAREQLAAMEALAGEAAGFAERERLFLLYALAKAYDETGDASRAFAAAEAGARLRRARWAGDETLELRRLAEAGPRDAERAGEGDPTEAPVFVFGMPRSGTSLVEQILASHPDVAALGETEVFAREAGPASDAKSLAGAYLAHWPEAVRKRRRVVDKSLGNLLEIGAIRRALPGARLVHVRRAPVDCCLSCFFTWFSGDMPFPPDLVGVGRYYRGYANLMAKWRAALPPQVLHEVAYERLVAEPEAEIRALLGFCGLDWDARCLTFHRHAREVRTASVAQVRRPLYADAVGRASRYEAFLEPLRQALEIGETQL